MWSLNTSYSHSLTLSPKDINYCSDCDYLIGVETSDETSLYLIDVEVGEDLGEVEKSL
jgi:hypothetical protein